MATLTGKTAVVTGVSRGIGRAILTRLVAEGADVVGQYSRSGELAEGIARDTGARMVQADLSSTRGVEAMIEAAGDRIDIGEPADVADVVAFLSGHDGRWISGQVIQVGGGTRL